MAPAGDPPVIATATKAWTDAFRAMAAMPVVAATGLALLIGLALLSDWLLSHIHTTLGNRWINLVTLVSGVLHSILLAPVAIAVHRYVLLGEAARSYPLNPIQSRYLRFVGFALLVDLFWAIPTYIQGLVPMTEAATGGMWWLNALAMVLFVVVIVVVVRRVILFPAIAVDAPAANWSNARRDTVGLSWTVALVLFCTALPAVAVGLVFVYVLAPIILKGETLGLSIMITIVHFVLLFAMAAAASHLYRALADVMTREADGRI
jgi:hypothetical protein